MGLVCRNGHDKSDGHQTKRGLLCRVCETTRKKKYDGLNMLDDKLREILDGFCKDAIFFQTPPIDNYAAYIDRLKQAFADEGYRLHLAENVVVIPQKGVMTGQEWYEKFRIEFRKLAPKSYAKDFYAKKAARNAAGIKDG